MFGLYEYLYATLNYFNFPQYLIFKNWLWPFILFIKIPSIMDSFVQHLSFYYRLTLADYVWAFWAIIINLLFWLNFYFYLALINRYFIFFCISTDLYFNFIGLKPRLAFGISKPLFYAFIIIISFYLNDNFIA